MKALLFGFHIKVPDCSRPHMFDTPICSRAPYVREPHMFATLIDGLALRMITGFMELPQNPKPPLKAGACLVIEACLGALGRLPSTLPDEG